MNKITKTLLIASSLFLAGCKFDGTGLGTSSDTLSEETSTSATLALTTSTSTSTSSSTSSTSTSTFGEEDVSSSEIDSTGSDPVCGNEIVETGEECDDGLESPICNKDCTKAECGDGYVNLLANEECDDGNLEDIDSCSNECVSSRTVFITSNVYFGDLGGINGANEECTNLAESVGLTGNYKAWLSEGTSKSVQVSARFDTNFKGWYVLVNGDPLAKGWLDLTENGPLTEILITELNNKLDFTHSIDVWTNTTNKGIYISGSPDCNNWGENMDNEFHGRIGDANSIEYWSNNTNKKYAECAVGARLYCFRDDGPKE